MSIRGKSCFPGAARGFYEAFVKRFRSAGERLVRRFLSEAGDGSSNQQYQRCQNGKVQGHSVLR